MYGPVMRVFGTGCGTGCCGTDLRYELVVRGLVRAFGTDLWYGSRVHASDTGSWYLIVP